MKRVLVLILIVLGVASACTSPSSASLSPDAFSQLAAQDSTVVVDVRTPAEFAQGHLPDAVNIDVEAASFTAQIAALDKNAAYAVYCRSGNRSKTAMEQMKAAGLQDVQDLDGGIIAWQAQGLPVV